MATLVPGIDTKITLSTTFDLLELSGAATGTPITGDVLDLGTEETSGTLYLVRGGATGEVAASGVDNKMPIPLSQLPISVPIGPYSRLLVACDTGTPVITAAVRRG